MPFGRKCCLIEQPRDSLQQVRQEVYRIRRPDSHGTLREFDPYSVALLNCICGVEQPGSSLGS